MKLVSKCNSNMYSSFIFILVIDGDKVNSSCNIKSQNSRKTETYLEVENTFNMISILLQKNQSSYTTYVKSRLLFLFLFHLERIYYVDDAIVSFSSDSTSSMKKQFQILELGQIQSRIDKQILYRTKLIFLISLSIYIKF